MALEKAGAHNNVSKMESAVDSGKSFGILITDLSKDCFQVICNKAYSQLLFQ